MNTEEDTFNRLRRSDFGIVHYEITNNYYAKLIRHSTRSDEEILAKHNWKQRDYIEELLKLNNKTLATIGLAK